MRLGVITMGLDTNNNSVFELKYKLVLKIKDISRIDKDCFLDKVCGMFEDISEKYGVNKDSIETKESALIIRFSAKPNTEMSKFINAYKSATSRKIKKMFVKDSEVREFWSKGYLLLTLGNDNDELVNKYI